MNYLDIREDHYLYALTRKRNQSFPSYEFQLLIKLVL